MSDPGNSFQLLTTLEGLLNSLLQKMFPIWYLKQSAREIILTPIGTINPSSFLSHRWLSLQSVILSLEQSLASPEGEWQELQSLLSKLLIEKEYPRRLSITAINGVEQSSHSDDWPSLLAYAEDNIGNPSITNIEEFDTKLHQAFPVENKPHRIVYREWDGRYYWLNPEEPNILAAMQLFARENNHDASINALINVESLSSRSLELLRNNWWLLILNREQASFIHAQMQQCGLPCALADFEWRRDDLSVLVARKNNRDINRIFLNLIDQRSVGDVLEFGSYLSRHHHPFRNH